MMRIYTMGILFALVMLGCAGKKFSTSVVKAEAPTAYRDAMDAVKEYAKGHKVTCTKRGGGMWVEAEGLDPFGVGATCEAAAESFLLMAGVMDSEVNRPAKETKELPCPETGDEPVFCTQSEI